MTTKFRVEQIEDYDGWIPSHETWTYASADDPTYTLTISGDKTAKYYPGMRVKLTQSTGGTKYFIITGVAYSSGTGLTTLTLYGGYGYSGSGYGYDLNNEAITSPYYSFAKAPTGFPLDPTIWEYKVTDTTKRSKTGCTGGQWYYLTSTPGITVPIGAWRLSYQLMAQGNKTVTSFSAHISAAFSTSSSSPAIADNIWVRRSYAIVDSSSFSGINTSVSLNAENNIILTAKQSYYPILMCVSDADLYLQNAIQTMLLKAECLYL
ncbi:MAG TPA: hypothetical protein PLI71_09850 [Clostridia bacterium]|nr:hypothetical protein [Clostridia bacterium]